MPASATPLRVVRLEGTVKLRMATVTVMLAAIHMVIAVLMSPVLEVSNTFGLLLFMSVIRIVVKLYRCSRSCSCCNGHVYVRHHFMYCTNDVSLNRYN